MLINHHSPLPPGTEFGDFSVMRGDTVRGHNRVVDFFFDYWRSKHQPGHLPTRADIRPPEIARYLDHVVIMDVARTDRGFTLKVRLIGTHVTAFYGEITGHDIHQMNNAKAADRIYELSGQVIESGIPHMSLTPAFAPDRQYLQAYALYMPLYGATGTVEKILVAVDIQSLHRQA